MQRQRNRGSNADREAGSVVLLSIAPETTFQKFEGEEGKLPVEGRPVEDQTQANILHLFHYSAKTENQIRDHVEELQIYLEFAADDQAFELPREVVSAYMIDHDRVIMPEENGTATPRNKAVSEINRHLTRMRPLIASEKLSPIGALLIAHEQFKKQTAPVMTGTAYANSASRALDRLKNYASAGDNHALFSELRRDRLETMALN